MSSLPKDKNSARGAGVAEDSYIGPNRRDPKGKDDKKISREYKFDDKGNSVLEVRTDARRRRLDDDTIDLLECLDVDDVKLELEED